jgi:hypothetical protein
LNITCASEARRSGLSFQQYRISARESQGAAFGQRKRFGQQLPMDGAFQEGEMPKSQIFGWLRWSRRTFEDFRLGGECLPMQEKHTAQG